MKTTLKLSVNTVMGLRNNWSNAPQNYLLGVLSLTRLPISECWILLHSNGVAYYDVVKNSFEEEANSFFDVWPHWRMPEWVLGMRTPSQCNFFPFSFSFSKILLHDRLARPFSEILNPPCIRTRGCENFFFTSLQMFFFPQFCFSKAKHENSNIKTTLHFVGISYWIVFRSIYNIPGKG